MLIELMLANGTGAGRYGEKYYHNVNIYHNIHFVENAFLFNTNV